MNTISSAYGVTINIPNRHQCNFYKMVLLKDNMCVGQQTFTTRATLNNERPSVRSIINVEQHCKSSTVLNVKVLGWQITYWMQKMSNSLFGQFCAYWMSYDTRRQTCQIYSSEEYSSQPSFKQIRKNVLQLSRTQVWSYKRRDGRTGADNDNTLLTLRAKGKTPMYHQI